MAWFGSAILVLLFSAANVAIGMAAAGCFGIGPLKSWRVVSFVCYPSLTPPVFLSQVLLRVRSIRLLLLLRRQQQQQGE